MYNLLPINEQCYKKRKLLDLDLIQAISFVHDIGHTAYGHIGERVLSEFIFGQDGASGGKVKHNFQSLKMCCFLEKQYKPDFYGLNLTITTLDGSSRNNLLKERYLGEFKDLKELKLELNLDEGEIKSIECMVKISNYYKEGIVMKLPAVAKWDIKGKELYEELSKKLCEVFKQDETGINLNISKRFI